MELNKILSDARWGDMAAFINANFEKIRVELMKLRYASILTFCKGYFSTESRLLSKYPMGKTGEYAFVGTPWPGTVWEWVDSAWVDTGVAPQLGESVFVGLLKRHIDNDTIYWDDVNEAIKAKGGGILPATYKITVGINPIDKSRGTVTATGANSVTLSGDGETYTIIASAGASVTVHITANTGFEVLRVNVDKVNKGKVTSFKFDNIGQDHTMYLWFQTKAQANPTDFLERSDLPGVSYSSLQEAFDSVKLSYPGGLTRDVTITCVKDAVFNRVSGLWISILSDWNQGSAYALTLDGGNLLTLDCMSLGGLRFERVDNIRLTGLRFRNAANYAGAGSPEELSAIYFIGDIARYSTNLHIDHCSIDGLYTQDSTKSGYYCVITKNTANVSVQSCDIQNFGVIAFKMVDCHAFSLLKNTINAGYIYGVIGHPALCTCSNGYALIVEDNTITSEMQEDNFTVTNMDVAIFRRNKMVDGNGRVATITSKTAMKRLVLESNLFAGMMRSPQYGWMHELVNFNDVDTLDIVNNTVYLNSALDYIHHFIQSQNSRVGTLTVYNNLISAVQACIGGQVRGIVLGTVGSASFGHNIYQFPVSGNVASGTVAALNGVWYNTVEKMVAAGIENAGSVLVRADVKLMRFQDGIPGDYSITADYDSHYPADGGRMAVDIEYKAKATDSNSRGCYNLHGRLINETDDASAGYTGENLSETGTFSSASQYSAPADSVLLISSATLNRGKYVRLSAEGGTNSALLLGRYGILRLNPVLDENGEYKENELYTINIE